MVSIIIFVNLDVQSADSPTVVTEVTARDMISGAGLCSIQGYIHICNKRKGKQKFYFGERGDLQGRFSSIIILYAFKLDNAMRRAGQYRYRDLE
jgi:hypothetical protein